MPELPEPKGMGLPAKFIAGFAAGAVIGFGLCGASLLTNQNGSTVSSNLAMLGAVFFFVCMTGLVGSVIWFVVWQFRRK